MGGTQRVGIVCEQTLLRELLQLHLQSGGFQLSFSIKALDDVPDLHVDGRTSLAIIKAPNGTASETSNLVGRARVLLPDAKIVMLTVLEDLDAQRAAIRAGADGVVHMDTTAQAFQESIRLVRSGERLFPSHLIDRAVMDPARGVWSDEPDTISDPLAKFTTTELWVLCFLVDGLKNKEIARAMDIAETTVKYHVRRVCRHTEANNRTQAALWAMAHGHTPDSLRKRIERGDAFDGRQRLRQDAKVPGRSAGSDRVVPLKRLRQ